MTINPIKSAIMVLSLVFLLPSVGFAKGSGGHHNWQDKFEELNLTEEQMKKVEDIYKNYKESKKGFKDKLKPLYEDLNNSLKSGASDEDIRTKYAALEAEKQKMGVLHVDKVLQIRAVLTKEQLANYEGFRMRGKHRGKKRK